MWNRMWGAEISEEQYTAADELQVSFCRENSGYITARNPGSRFDRTLVSLYNFISISLMSLESKLPCLISTDRSV